MVQDPKTKEVKESKTKYTIDGNRVEVYLVGNPSDQERVMVTTKSRVTKGYIKDGVLTYEGKNPKEDPIIQINTESIKEKNISLGEMEVTESESGKQANFKLPYEDNITGLEIRSNQNNTDLKTDFTIIEKDGKEDQFNIKINNIKPEEKDILLLIYTKDKIYNLH